MTPPVNTGQLEGCMRRAYNIPACELHTEIKIDHDGVIQYIQEKGFIRILIKGVFIKHEAEWPPSKERFYFGRQTVFQSTSSIETVDFRQSGQTIPT